MHIEKGSFLNILIPIRASRAIENDLFFVWMAIKDSTGSNLLFLRGEKDHLGIAQHSSFDQNPKHLFQKMFNRILFTKPGIHHAVRIDVIGSWVIPQPQPRPKRRIVPQPMQNHRVISPCMLLEPRSKSPVESVSPDSTSQPYHW